ncbi:hypothetical protein [Methanoregula sp.]|uniref:hypothetical protein n=1 Tax=Methanoregula sp. TaxID=2052170 RepID=UPI0035628235
MGKDGGGEVEGDGRRLAGNFSRPGLPTLAISPPPASLELPGPYVLAIIKIGRKIKPVFRRIATDGESGIIHYGTMFVPVE